jgi:hypothetical protein
MGCDSRAWSLNSSGAEDPVAHELAELPSTCLEEEGGRDQEGEEEIGEPLAARVVEEGGHVCSPVWCSYPMGVRKT